MEAFVLISGGSGTDTDAALQQGRSAGTWSGEAIGEFDAIVKIEAPNPTGLRRQVRAIKGDTGALRTETLVVVRPRPCPVKRTSQPAGWELALCLVELRRGTLGATLQELERRKDRNEIAAFVVVNGSADLIVEVWGRDDEDLQDRIEKLQDLDGIRRQRTTYVETVSGSRA